MATFIDARGLGCPQPVILTKKALETAATAVCVIVDNDVARENVSRFGRKQGGQVVVREEDDGTYISITKEGSPAGSVERVVAAPAAVGGPTVITLGSDRMGRGDDTLGELLMRMYVHTITEVSPLPDVIIFLNAGVKLAVNGAKTLEDVQALEKRGVDIVVCGTCLGHFELTDQVGAGEVSNMYSIAEILIRAGRIVSL